MNLHRERKHLFDASAELYDRYRPGYPRELIDRMISFSGVSSSGRILEIGSGTGKATVEFASRGFSVECVEPGVELCDRLRDNCGAFPGVSVLTEEFEKADLPERAYDLVFSAQAFHWVLPSVRYRKTYRILKPGGTLAVFWNYFPETGSGPLHDIDLLFRRRIPSGMVKPAFPFRKTISRWRKELSRQHSFENLSMSEYPWSTEYSTEEYVRLCNTHSDFIALPPGLRDELTEEIRTIISNHGGTVVRPYVAVLYCLRKKLWDD